mmetsp:Transcript_20210/g.47309  ORF Transcript_20210/g.47309 Transcript_20210/m.47309 type:complete len:134 (+) Transcript_20210:124-525(+)
MLKALAEEAEAGGDAGIIGGQTTSFCTGEGAVECVAAPTGPWPPQLQPGERPLEETEGEEVWEFHGQQPEPDAAVMGAAEPARLQVEDGKAALEEGYEGWKAGGQRQQLPVTEFLRTPMQLAFARLAARGGHG